MVYVSPGGAVEWPNSWDSAGSREALPAPTPLPGSELWPVPLSSRVPGRHEGHTGGRLAIERFYPDELQE